MSIVRIMRCLAEPGIVVGDELWSEGIGSLYRRDAAQLLIPLLSSLAALRLAAVMVGAAMTNQFLLEESPWLPLALLVVAAVIAWARRSSNIASAMLNNPAGGGRTPIIDGNSNMVVFFPAGTSATFSDPSYHLPAFYELFAQDGSQNDSARWRQVADVSRQYFVTSANANTGLHPDYANFNGTPNSDHDQFRYDAWRVVMNMAIDYEWGSQDQRLKTQIEKYHSFFTTHLGDGNVQNALFALNGTGASGNGSTALTATLASGALVSAANNRADYVQNLWDVGQQSGQYRYYQETVYMLGLLATAGLFGYEWADSAQ